MNRKKAVVKTAITGIFSSLLTTILGFITQSLFVKNLGIERSGINGTLTSIIGILTMADFGVSTAVALNLYKPLAKEQKSTIAAIMQFYHKACIIIGSFVIIGSMAILPFISHVIGETSVTDNLYIIFALFAISAAFTYFLNYRRVLLQADQKAFIINRVMTITLSLTYVAKITILIILKDYYLFVLTTVVFKIAENLVISLYVKKNYPYISKKRVLEKSIKTDIAKKMYASVYHNAGGYIVTSTDNLLLTRFFGVASTGIYANYLMITTAVGNLTYQFFSGISASMGNLLTKNGKDYLFIVTKRVTLVSTLVYTITAIATFYCLNPFIQVWLGDDYIFNQFISLLLATNFLLSGLRQPSLGVLNAAGIVYENRFIPLAEAAINLLSSVILAKTLGIPGVFLGTIISNLFLHLYAYPKYAFKTVLNKGRFVYYKILAKNLLFYSVALILVAPFDRLTTPLSPMLRILILGVSSIIIAGLLFLLFFFKTEEFAYFRALSKEKLTRRRENKTTNA